MSNSFAIPWTVACQAPLPRDFPGKITRVGYHFFPQGIFLTQGSKTGLGGEMRLRAQPSIPKLNTVVNKTTTFMKSVMLFFYTFSDGSVVKNLPAMQEMQVWSLGQEDPLKKEMAIHSSILAWEIPWTMVPGGLQSMGLQRDRHDLPTKQQHMTKSMKKENS